MSHRTPSLAALAAIVATLAAPAPPAAARRVDRAPAPRVSTDSGKRGAACVDRDRDGRCDEHRRGGRQLPRMTGVLTIERGRRTAEIERWVGTGWRRIRYLDTDRDGRPEVMSFVDDVGRPMQVWRDRDHDGRADVVEVYHEGRVVRTIR